MHVYLGKTIACDSSNRQSTSDVEPYSEPEEPSVFFAAPGRIQEFDEDVVKFRLRPGERRGWWADHDSGERDMVAMVHGAVCDVRTRIMLDSGASTNIICPSLVRRLGLKVSTTKKLAVKGFSGTTTYISSQVKVKIMLGERAVYFLKMWVGHIGEGIQCLLGMSFMRRAGVRLCASEAEALLPDEERIPLLRSQGATPPARVDIPITTG